MENNDVLNSETTIESIDTMSDDKKANYMLQRMISDYLSKLELPSMEEILKKQNQVEEPGILTDTHIKLLQCMVKDFYQASGSSVEIVAREKGITLKEGILSSIEKECIDNLLTDYCKSVKNVIGENN